MKYFVESNNGIGAFGVIAEFEKFSDAKQFADNYARFNGVKTRVTTI